MHRALTSLCPNACSLHGSCYRVGVQFLCRCRRGYEGVDCSVNSSSLSTSTVAAVTSTGSVWLWLGGALLFVLLLLLVIFSWMYRDRIAGFFSHFFKKLSGK